MTTNDSDRATAAAALWNEARTLKALEFFTRQFFIEVMKAKTGPVKLLVAALEEALKETPEMTVEAFTQQYLVVKREQLRIENMVGVGQGSQKLIVGLLGKVGYKHPGLNQLSPQATALLAKLKSAG